MKGPHARHTFSAVKHTSILNLTIAHSKRNSNHAYNQLQTGVQDILGMPQNLLRGQQSRRQDFAM